jgi:hypothetical protein
MYPRLKAFSAEKFTFNNSHSPYRYIGHKDREQLHNTVVDGLRTVLPQWLRFAGRDAKEDRINRVRA